MTGEVPSRDVWYVTVADKPFSGGKPDDVRVGFLLGPYDTDTDAEQKIPDAKRLAATQDDRAAFYAYGTTRAVMPAGKQAPPGILNHLLDPPDTDGCAG